MTLAYDYLGTVRGYLQNIPNYIVATALDTTATVNGPAIRNEGNVRRVSFGIIGKNKTGTSPTLTALLQGSNDGTNWFSVLDSAGNAITTTALSINLTNGTEANYAIEFEDTNQEGINAFPPFLRVRVSVGGTATPGGTYDINLLLDRSPLPAA
jgi:hypothetical protein